MIYWLNNPPKILKIFQE